MSETPYAGKDDIKWKMIELRAQADRLEWILANGPCTMCGTWAEPTIDHIDKKLKSRVLIEKNQSTIAIFKWPMPVRERELANCQVLCTTHHKYKTQAEMIFERKIAACDKEIAEAVEAWIAARAAGFPATIAQAEQAIGARVQVKLDVLKRGLVL